MFLMKKKLWENFSICTYSLNRNKTVGSVALGTVFKKQKTTYRLNDCGRDVGQISDEKIFLAFFVYFFQSRVSCPFNRALNVMK